MSTVLSRLFHREARTARTAKERLREVLILDRTSLSPKELDLLKDDLIKTISKHVDIEVTLFHLDMSHKGRIHRLIVDVPIRSSHQHRSG